MGAGREAGEKRKLGEMPAKGDGVAAVGAEQRCNVPAADDEGSSKKLRSLLARRARARGHGA